MVRRRLHLFVIFSVTHANAAELPLIPHTQVVYALQQENMILTSSQMWLELNNQTLVLNLVCLLLLVIPKGIVPRLVLCCRRFLQDSFFCYFFLKT